MDQGRIRTRVTSGYRHDQSHPASSTDSRYESYLVPSLQSGLGSLAVWLHGVHEDSEAPLAAAMQAEVQWRLPGCLLEADLPPLGLGGACNVQQPQVALHLLEKRRRRWWLEHIYISFSKLWFLKIGFYQGCATAVEWLLHSNFKCIKIKTRVVEWGGTWGV